jgi:hypothetical protein
VATLALLSTLVTSAHAGPTYFEGGIYRFHVGGVAAVPEVDYEPVRSSAPIDLDGDGLHFVVSAPEGFTWLYCRSPILEDGQVYTLFSTTGELSGELEAPGGGALKQGETITVYEETHEEYGCGGYEVPGPASLRIEYHESGEPQTVTGTVVNGSTERVSAVFDSGSPRYPVTNQPVTLTARVEASRGLPEGALEFQRPAGAPIAGCEQLPVTEIRGGYGAVCTATFQAREEEYCGGGPECNQDTRVAFEPAVRADLTSSGGEVPFAVRPAPTTMGVAASTQDPVVGEQVIYTATVTPEYLGPAVPDGKVAFLDGGKTVEGCEHQPLVPASGGVSSATCDVTYHTVGDHSVGAEYAGSPRRSAGGSGNFLGSMTAAPQDVIVQPVPAAVQPISIASANSLLPSASGTAGSATHGSAGALPAGDVVVGSRSVAVRGRHTAILELSCGRGLACYGKVALSGRGRTAARVPYGTATFSLAPGNSEAVPIVLNGAGRAALASRRIGRAGTLTVTADSAGPSQTQTVPVDLVHG